MKKYIVIFFGLVLTSTAILAQTPQKPTSGEIYESIKKLNFLGSVLYVGAHPDDENTRLISYLSNDVKARTAYLSVTRGDGGQNLIGPEISEILGVIRTHELLEARKIDGAEQYFTRANDFGYSKHSDESEIILEGVGMDIYNQNITSVTWTKTGGNGFLEAYNNDFYAYGSGSPNRPWTITGYVTVTNPCGSTIYNFTLTGSDVGTCLPQFRKIAKNQYRIIDPCDSNTIQKINESELYSQYGYKVQDLIPDNDKIDVNNTSEPGTIKVIKVSTNFKTISKLIIID